MLILGLFLLFTAMKTDSKFTLHHMGNIFIIYLNMTKFKIWTVTFFKSFLTSEKLFDGLPVFQK